MAERNALGGQLEPCGTDPVTGFYRDGNCSCGPEDVGLHAVCAVMTPEFLAHQQQVGNDLVTPRPEWSFPGLHPGDRWCVVAARWLQATEDGRGGARGARLDQRAGARGHPAGGTAQALGRRPLGPRLPGVNDDDHRTDH